MRTNKKRGETGELAFFQELWDKLPHYCEVTGQRIESFSPWNFHHLLSKAAYKGYRLHPKNILICTPETHHKIHIGTLPEEDSKWIDELTQNLKSSYYNESNKNYGRHPGI